MEPSFVSSLPPGSLSVIVVAVAGDVLELKLEPEHTIGTLKFRIADQWLIPADCQQLLCGVCPLDDPGLALRALAEEAGSPIRMSMLVSLHGLQARLDSINPRVRCSALEVLFELPTCGRKAAVDFAAGCLGHWDDGVRQAAVESLAALAEHSQEQVVASIEARFGDRDSEMRQSAVMAMGRCVERGNEDAIRAVTSRLSDKDSRVRLEAVHVLTELAPRGNAQALQALLRRLRRDHSPMVREAVIDAVLEVAEADDARVVDAMCLSLEDSNALVCQAAQRVMARVLRELQSKLKREAAADSGRAIAEASAFLEHPSPFMRRAAGSMVLQAAGGQQEDPQAMHAVSARLEHGNEHIRTAAAAALAEVAGKSRDAVTLVAPLAEHASPGVRCAALRALASVSHRGDAEALSIIAPLLRDADGEVRAQASESWTEVAKPGDPPPAG